MDDDATDEEDHTHKNDAGFEEWSGSGIWEREENRRWEVVRDHIIPMRDLLAGETSLMSNLGIGHYLQNFESEVEVGPGNFKIVSSGSSLVRLDADTLPVCDSDENPNQESLNFSDSVQHDPVPGPSGVSNTGRLITDVPVPQTSRSQPNNRKSSFVRAKKKRRKRLRSAKRNCRGRTGTLETRLRSAESSPGRETPSPTTLASICQYWQDWLASPEYIIHSDSD